MPTSSPSLQSSLAQPTYQTYIPKKSLCFLFSTFFPTFSLLFAPSLACTFLHPMSPFSSLLLYLSWVPIPKYIFLYTCREVHNPFLSNKIIDAPLVYDIFASLSLFETKWKAELDNWRETLDKKKKKKTGGLSMDERVLSCFIFLLLGHFLYVGELVVMFLLLFFISIFGFITSILMGIFFCFFIVIPIALPCFFFST